MPTGQCYPGAPGDSDTFAGTSLPGSGKSESEIPLAQDQGSPNPKSPLGLFLGSSDYLKNCKISVADKVTVSDTRKIANLNRLKLFAALKQKQQQHFFFFTSMSK